jgi:hypothetical protein
LGIRGDECVENDRARHANFASWRKATIGRMWLTKFPVNRDSSSPFLRTLALWSSVRDWRSAVVLGGFFVDETGQFRNSAR